MKIRRFNIFALKYFLKELYEDKLIYDEGKLWRMWEPRRNWLEIPKRAEKITGNGYYILRTTRKKLGKPIYVMTHRVIWAFFKGAKYLKTDEYEIHHKNNNRTDNRIENLELVTRSENLQYAVKDGLWNAAKAEKHYRCKLTNKDVKKIKKMLKSEKYFQKEIADLFGVRPNQISRIKTGARRSYVKF